MGEYEDLLEQARELDEDLAAGFEKFKSSTLRRKAEERDDLERQLNETRERLQEFENAPQKRGAFEQYGVDFDQLKPAERRLVESYDGELDEEKIAEFVAELDLPLTQKREEEQQPAAANVAAQARQGPGRQGGGSISLSPEQVREWPIDKMLRFKDEHPEAWESIKQGETVTGVTFS